MMKRLTCKELRRIMEISPEVIIALMSWFHCKKVNSEDIFAKSGIISLVGGLGFCHWQIILRSVFSLTTQE